MDTDLVYLVQFPNRNVQKRKLYLKKVIIFFRKRILLYLKIDADQM